MLGGALAVLALLAGCSGTQEAVAGGTEFAFVAPGGKTFITYDPPESRGTVTGISGDSLLRPGETVGLDDYAGRVVVLNLWGSWCGPCREEVPDLQFVAEQTGAAVLGIDLRDDRQAATDFLRDRAVTYDSIYDNPGRTLVALSGYPRNAVPSTLVLDKRHRVAAVDLLQIRPSELIPLVERLKAEP
ncbi:TlpA family protein disulfide reductase [Pseudonocardia lacus]|uniref:TlpA family protein disulfide reductase n=1 Tax=Pseudonocardia lacus TaxID=2835865 RepID=UPI001BDCA910|nr:TlpA disulfide reductase family protein [Pseudonocardia lacus]